MQQRFLGNTLTEVNLTIIGMGGAGTSLFIQLVEQLALEKPEVREKIRIELIEKSDIAGPGFAYNSRDQYSSVFTLNNSNDKMSLFGPKNFGDFVDWLTANKIETTMYAPRSVFGEYCNSRFEEYFRKAKDLNIKVKLSLNTEVIKADKDMQGNWILKTVCGELKRNIKSENIVVATGHLPSKQVVAGNPENYFKDVYSKQLEVENDKPVIILGSGLTSIDALKELLNCGHKAPIYMASPSGELPKIKPDKNLDFYTFTYLTPENLKDISIAKILDLFCKELGVETDNPRATIEKLIKSDNPQQAFLNELADVQQAERKWQKILGTIWYDVLFIIAHNIKEEEREEFFNQYFKYFLKWAAGMTLDNAKLIERVLGKQLQLVAYQGEVTQRDNLFQITTKSGETISAPYLINGVGAGYDIDDSTLLKAMQKKQLAAKHQSPGGIKINQQFQVLDSNNVPHENAWSIGVVTFGSNPSANSIICAAINAQTVVQQLTPVLISVPQNTVPGL